MEFPIPSHRYSVSDSVFAQIEANLVDQLIAVTKVLGLHTLLKDFVAFFREFAQHECPSRRNLKRSRGQ
jgi:hypothetical protein